MLVTNHVLAGALVGLAAPGPVSAFLGGVASHVALDVVAAMSMCAVIVTDSGSIVEEANVLEVPCVTLRFGSDRSETFLAGSNFLAPPIDKALMTTVIHNVFEHRTELSWDRVYPEGASRMLVDAVEKRLGEGSLLISEEWRYGLKAQLR